MLLRADVFTNECFAIHICLEFFNRLGTSLLRDSLKLVKPHMSHFTRKLVPRVVILGIVGLSFGLGKQCDVLRADHPSLSDTIPADLYIFAIGLQSL